MELILFPDRFRFWRLVLGSRLCPWWRIFEMV